MKRIKDLRDKLLYNVNRALQASAQGDTPSLKQYAETLAELSESEDGAADISALACIVGARVAQADANTPESVTLLRRALDELGRSRKPRVAGFILLNLSHASTDPGVALQAALEALRQFEVADDERGIASACLNLGSIHAELGRHEQGMEYLSRARTLTRSLEDRYGEALAVLNMASSAIVHGLYDEGLMLATQCVRDLEEFAALPDARRIAFVWQTSGWASVPARCDAMLGTAYNNLGNVLGYLGESNAAISYYLRARDLVRAAGDPRGEAMVANQIGDSFRAMGDAVEAESYFRESCRLFEESGVDDYMYATALQGVGEACASQGRFPEASEFFGRALEAFARDGNALGESEVMMLKGELYGTIGERSSAESILRSALERAESVAATEIVVRCHKALGMLLMRVDSSKAKDHLRTALMLAGDHSMKVEQLHIHRELATYWKLVNDPMQALSHYEEFDGLRNEIAADEAERQLRNFAIVQRVEEYRRQMLLMAERVREVEADLAEKTRELASLAERIMQKREFVQLVAAGLKKLMAARPERKDRLAQDLLDEIQSAADVRGDSVELTRKFLHIHREFASHLADAAPGITETELQVCVLLRLSMLAKQVAYVMGIKEKTVYNHQRSIRTKLGLSRKDNLKGYLISLDSNRQRHAANGLAQLEASLALPPHVASSATAVP